MSMYICQTLTHVGKVGGEVPIAGITFVKGFEEMVRQAGE